MAKLKKFMQVSTKNFAIIYVVLGTMIIFEIITNLVLKSNLYLGQTNLINILRQSTIVAIMGAGEFFVIASGMIDLSVGSTVAASSIVYAAVFKLGGNEMMVPAILAAVCVGLIVGAINGILVSRFNIPPFVATLGTMYIARGVVYVATGCYPIIDLPSSYGYPGSGWLLGIPFPVIIMVVVFVFAITIAEKKKMGRFMYAIGGNTDAAYLSGINVKKYKTVAMILAGIFYSIAGIILAGRLGSGQPNSANGYEFDAIIAVVMGGVSFSGGKGKALNVFFGALFMTLLINGMTLLAIDSYVQQITKGIIFVLAIGFDVYRNKKG
jgi:ribose transport system permease protein